MPEEVIKRILGEAFGCRRVNVAPRSGLSDLNHCLVCDTDKGSYFLKYQNGDAFKMYQAEFFCLERIAETKTVKVPKPLYCGMKEGVSVLVLEFLDLHPHTPKTQEQLGRQLALLHNSTRMDKFGFEIDNTIGTTPQINQWNTNWTTFYCEYRLKPLFDAITQKFDDKDLGDQGQQLIHRVPGYFGNDIVSSSLLHGDLWCGNTAVDSTNTPVIFDPASYYGHDECDLSIAMMFGGFHQSFYSAYHEINPKSAGFDERNLIYQLYHYLNHYLLFGDTYRSSCVRIIKSLYRS